jgi:hypothetical protein
MKIATTKQMKSFYDAINILACLFFHPFIALIFAVIAQRRAFVIPLKSALHVTLSCP